MRNLKKLVLLSGMSAVIALTGCEALSRHNSESDRTAGRALDDKTVTAAVRHDLDREPVYKFDSVDVKTFDGVVQLSGFVDSDQQKHRAEDVAKRSEGVTQVVNNITLKPAGSTMAPTGRPNGYDNNYNNNNNR